MASTLLSLVAKLGLDDSEYKQGLSGAAGFAKKGLKAAGVALGAATAAVGAFATKSVQTGMEFDKSMSQVAATMGKTSEEMQNEVGSVDLAWGTFNGNLREYAQEMGANTAFTATEAADALNYMALAGYDTQTSMSMLPNVLNLAAAGSIDLAKASDMVTDTQTAFGISLDRTNQMVDEMAKAASTGNTSVEQLGDAFLTVGGLAQELNGGMLTLEDGTTNNIDGIQELETALTAMANAGIKGSEAGTHMRNMLLKLSSPTDAGVSALKAMGVSVFDTAGQMRSLSDIFGDLSNAMGSMTQEQKIKTISDLFNTRDLASAEALLNAVNSDWDQIGASIVDSEGAAQKMADTQLDNLAGDITLFKSALEGVQVGISDGLSPTLRDFVQTGTSGLTTITKAVKEGGLVGGFEAIGEVLGNVVSKIVEYAPEIINAAMKLINALVDSLLQQAPTILENILKILQNVMTSLSVELPRILQVMTDILPELINMVAQQFPALFTLLINTAVDVLTTLINSDMLTNLLQSLLTLVNAIAQAIIDNIPTIIAALPVLIQNIVEFIITAIPMLIEAGLQLFLALITALPDIIGGIVAAIPQIIDGIINAIINALPLIITAGLDLFLALIGALPTIIVMLVGAIPKIIDGLVKGFKKLFPTMMRVGIDILKQVLVGIIHHITHIKETVQKVFDKLKEEFSGFGSKAKGWGKDMLQGFIDGITAKIQAVKDTVTDVGTAIKELLHFSVPDEGPLADADTWMPDFMDLLTEGIDAGLPKLANSIGDVAGIIDNGFAFDSEYPTYESVDDTQKFEFTFAEGNAPLLQIARLIFPYMSVVAKEKGVTI